MSSYIAVHPSGQGSLRWYAQSRAKRAPPGNGPPSSSASASRGRASPGQLSGRRHHDRLADSVMCRDMGRKAEGNHDAGHGVCVSAVSVSCNSAIALIVKAQPAALARLALWPEPHQRVSTRDHDAGRRVRKELSGGERNGLQGEWHVAAALCTRQGRAHCTRGARTTPPQHARGPGASRRRSPPRARERWKTERERRPSRSRREEESAGREWRERRRRERRPSERNTKARSDPTPPKPPGPLPLPPPLSL
eukprot:scaffold42270_cov30-Tisochrysis_lutea.AAC.1